MESKVIQVGEAKIVIHADGRIEVIPPPENKEIVKKQKVPGLRMAPPPPGYKLAGFSEGQLASAMKRYLNVDLDKKKVAAETARIDEEAGRFLQRPLGNLGCWALIIGSRGLRDKTLFGVIGLGEDKRQHVLTVKDFPQETAAMWREVFTDLWERGLDPNLIRVAVLPDNKILEIVFSEMFKKAVVVRDWRAVQAELVSRAGIVAFSGIKKEILRIQNAKNEKDAYQLYENLKNNFKADKRYKIVFDYLDTQIDALLLHHAFEPRLQRALKSSNQLARLLREVKTTRADMPHVKALKALKMEYNWARRPVDSPALRGLKWLRKNSEPVV